MTKASTTGSRCCAVAIGRQVERQAPLPARPAERALDALPPSDEIIPGHVLRLITQVPGKFKGSGDGTKGRTCPRLDFPQVQVAVVISSTLPWYY